MADNSGLFLFFPLSPSSCSRRQGRAMVEEKRPDSYSVLSLELTLSTPSCRHNSAGLPPSQLERVEFSSSNTSSLERTLSSSPRARKPDPTTSEQEVSSSSSTINYISLKLDLGPPASDEIGELAYGGDVERQPGRGEAKEAVVSKKRKVDSVEEPAGTEGAAAGSSDPCPSDSEPAGPTWRETARRLRGSSPTRVLQKKLPSTDVKTSYSRFLLTRDHEEEKAPVGNKPHCKGPKKLLDMLTDAEKALAASRAGLPVLLLDGRGEVYPGNKLKYWGGGGSYVILGRWNDFVHRNELDAGDEVEVHVFRVPPEMAALAGPPPTTVPVPPAAAEPEASMAPAPADIGGGDVLAFVLCSLVDAAEQESRRKQSPSTKILRRRQKEDSMTIKRRKKERVDR